MSHFLTILEVSQKQAYIFSSNMLKDNVVNSAVIAWIMSPKYFSEVIGDRNIFDEEKRGCGRFLGPELSNSKTASILHRTQTP